MLRVYIFRSHILQNTNDSNRQRAGVKARATSDHEDPGFGFHPGPLHIDRSPAIVRRHVDECTKEW